MVEQGWPAVALAEDARRPRARRRRGRGAARGDRPPCRAGARSRRRCSRSRPLPRADESALVERLLGDGGIGLRRLEPQRRRRASDRDRRRLRRSPGGPTRRCTRRRHRSPSWSPTTAGGPGLFAVDLDTHGPARSASRRWIAPGSWAGSRFERHRRRCGSAAPTRSKPLLDRGAVFACGRDARRCRRGARPRGRVREGPRAVRPADRQLPGGQAPLRRHARRRRGHALDDVLGGVVRRRRRPGGVGRGVDGEDLVRRTRRSG